MPTKSEPPSGSHRESLARALADLGPDLMKAGIDPSEVVDYLGSWANLLHAYGWADDMIRELLSDRPAKLRRFAQDLRRAAEYADREGILRKVPIAEILVIASKAEDQVRLLSRPRGRQTNLWRIATREKWETLARARTGGPLHELGALVYSRIFEIDEDRMGGKYFEQLIARDNRRYRDRRSRIDQEVASLQARKRTPHKTFRKQ